MYHYRNIKHLFSSWEKKFLKSDKGVALLEFAIAVPILSLLFFGMVEISAVNYSSTKSNFANIIIAHAVASSLRLEDESSDANANNNINNKSDFINNIFRAAEKTVEGHVEGNKLQAVLTIIKNRHGATNPQKPFVLFQQNYKGLASEYFTYSRGTETSIDNSYMTRNAISPNNPGIEGYEFVGNEQVIVVETKFKYNANQSSGTNFLGTLFHGKEVEQTSGIIRVRIGAFNFLPDRTQI